MVRRKYSLLYMVDRYDEKCWWQDKKWRRFEDLDKDKKFMNGAMFHKAKPAFKCFNSCPKGSILQQFFYVHGKRYCKEYEMI